MIRRNGCTMLICVDRGMYEAPTREEVTIGEFGYLVQCLQVAQFRDIPISRLMRFKRWPSC